jgi:hypothetical protein
MQVSFSLAVIVTKKYDYTIATQQIIDEIIAVPEIQSGDYPRDAHQQCSY